MSPSRKGLHIALQTLYAGSADITRLGADNNETPFNTVSKAFKKAMGWLHRKRGFQPEMLAEPEPIGLITATHDVLATELKHLDQRIPPEMAAALDQNVFLFSGFKTWHQLDDASRLLKDPDTGGFKPFDRFLQDVQRIDQAYNRNYLQAEYNFATASTLMAARWAGIAKDGDQYDLQYRTALDERVREDHAALEGITLPPSNPFWDKYYPPNGWNCRCTAVQVMPGKYERSDPQRAMEAGERATTRIGKSGVNRAAIFRFNPGKTGKVFPPKHPYFPKGCGDCQYKNGRNLSYNPNNPNCLACDAIAKCLNRFGTMEQIRQRRKEIRNEAKKFADVDFFNEKFNKTVKISNRNIKELTNQPHKHYNEKNEAILKIDELFRDSDYLGELKKEHPDDDFSSFLFETKIADEKSWIIVRKYNRGADYLIYSISDQPSIIDYLK